MDYTDSKACYYSELEKESTDIVLSSPLNESDVEAAFDVKTVSAVIVTLNAPRKTDNPFSASVSPPRLMADSRVNIV